MAAVPLLASISTSLVTSCQTFADTYVSQVSQGQNWTSMVDAFMYWEAGPSNEWAAISLTQAKSNPAAGDVTAFAFAMGALSMSWYADSTLSMEAADASSVLAGVSMALSFLTLRSVTGESNVLASMSLAILGMDVAAFGTAIYDWTHGA